MAHDSISEQLMALANETQEHVRYLQELGIETFAANATQPPPPEHAATPVKTEPSLSKVAKPEPGPISKAKVQPPAPAVSLSASAVPSAPDTLFAKIFPAPIERLPESSETFDQIHAEIGNCTRCPLSEGRTNVVHTDGNRKARLMFVGEAPGADEDAQARPFVGRAGQLLTKIIEAIGLKREEVLIGNVNRCRPPGNRAPTPDEVAMCKPFLLREIAVARPEVIVVLGNTAMKNLLEIKEGITRVRGVFQNYKGVKVMPTFHPAYLLRDPSKKRETWEDLKKVRALLDSTTDVHS
jgi:uracil-DNA glycosylase